MGPCIAAAVAGLLAVPPGAVVEGGLARRLDRHFSRVVPFGFAGTVLLARGDHVLLHRGYGWADPGTRVPARSGPIAIHLGERAFRRLPS